MLYTRDGAYLTAQPHLSCHTGIHIDGRIHVAAEHRRYDTQVDGGVGDPQTACDIEKHILGGQLEAHSLLQYSQQHIESPAVEPRGAALCRAIGRRADQRLGLYHKGTHTLHRAGYGHAREAVAVVCQKQFAGVGHLAQSVVAHLVDAQLAGAAEAVLDASQDAVHVVLVSLKLKYGIHDMLQHLGACQRALLIYMADEQDAGSSALGILEQAGCTLPYLRQAAGAALHCLGLYGLYGVDDHQVGMGLLYLYKDLFKRCLGEHQQVAAAPGTALPHLL